MQHVRVADAHDRISLRVEAQETHEPNGLPVRRFPFGRAPFDPTTVVVEDRGLRRPHEIEKGWPWQEGGVQPKGLIRDEIVDARGTQGVATRSAASKAARGRHEHPMEAPDI